jgi:hypothetical protein
LIKERKPLEEDIISSLDIRHIRILIELESDIVKDLLDCFTLCQKYLYPNEPYRHYDYQLLVHDLIRYPTNRKHSVHLINFIDYLDDNYGLNAISNVLIDEREGYMLIEGYSLQEKNK